MHVDIYVYTAYSSIHVFNNHYNMYTLRGQKIENWPVTSERRQAVTIIKRHWRSERYSRLFTGTTEP